jgi:amidase
VSSADLMLLLEELDAYRSDMLAYMQSYDIIVCPTAAFPATPHGTWKLGGIYREYSHTSAYNLTGWPGGVVRAGTSPEGLPINVQIVARPWREDVVLAVLAHVEERFGGWVMPAV